MVKKTKATTEITNQLTNDKIKLTNDKKKISNEGQDICEEVIIKNLIDVKKLEINELPDGVKVATMCSSCFLGTKLNLDNIEKYMNLDENDILTVKRNKDNIRSLIEIKKASKRNTILKKKQAGNNFYNSITLIVRVTTGPTKEINDEPRINIKLFKNGSIQMSGCKNVQNVNSVLEKVLYRLKMVKGKMENGRIEEITFIEDTNKLEINNFKIDMIYCNYKISMQVDREKLYDLLKKKKVKCIYEPCIRACVIIKFCASVDNPDKKELSIFIFKKGNIIITGARSRNQVIEAYSYINNIFIVHADEIIKKSDEDEEELIMNLYNDVLKDANKGLITI
jgi:TATA-box binding protein (TBP) (component of TFIID and TFIIIB)